MYDEYAAAAEQVRPFVADTGRLLNGILREGGSVMFEGAQGTMLDIDHGTYPFVTSSSATAGGACDRHRRGSHGHRHGYRRDQGLRHARRRRARSPPRFTMPSAIISARAATSTARSPAARGAAAGSIFRCLRYSNQVNGAEWLVVTKMDVLDELEEIPICVGYEIDGKVTDEIPADVHGLEAIKPVYTRLKGWQQSTEGITDFEKLPAGGAGLSALPGAGERRAHRDGLHRPGSGPDHGAAEFAAALDEIHA